MCFVGFLEEVIFRGLLFRAMGGSASRSAILVAALTFGMGHAVNLLLGEPVLDTLLQLVYASAIGFCFIAVFCVSGTIWPCILAHVFINSTSVFAVQPGEGKAVAMALVQTLLGVAYGSWLFYRSKKTGSKLFAREPNASVPVFRLAKASEKERIMEIYSSVKGTEFCVWDPDYPGPAEWKQDFETGNLFVLEERGRIAAAISVLPENELFDLGIWPKELEAFEFARVAVSPEYQGRGFAALMVQNVEAVVKDRGGKRIHILAAPGNLPAVKTYEKLGYRTVGECFAYGHDYLAMEKELQQAGSPANR
jgi:ribosomal protein S18 acetylase RimI-like enzyme